MWSSFRGFTSAGVCCKQFNGNLKRWRASRRKKICVRFAQQAYLIAVVSSWTLHIIAICTTFNFSQNGKKKCSPLFSLQLAYVKMLDPRTRVCASGGLLPLKPSCWRCMIHRTQAEKSFFNFFFTFSAKAIELSDKRTHMSTLIAFLYQCIVVLSVVTIIAIAT